ncbi:L-threonylcarbamoyladenylate synthase [Coraliomargarita parva]|uniref:L-threonylcarbamoyladenylate synthase n=1 Tax=Coraliomargarita parva TaxID=3014050 RepID=UPI0022B526E0|nr:L-threonylcarbamoyladenylate synthase [Coraliomargarita parva]
MSSTSRILSPEEANLERCARHLEAGELVGVPTETVYGLAGDASREDAVRKIFTVKGRPLIDPLIVHVPSLEAARKYAALNPAAEALAARFWPGPLTLVLPKKAIIPDIVTAGLPSVAIRCPAHPVFRALLERLDFPVAAPSANPFSYISPTTAAHVDLHLGHKIAATLDGGECQHGVESTIVDLRTPETPAILRYGPISPESISETLGSPVRLPAKTNQRSAQAAPGTLEKHYSPRTRVTLLEHGSAHDRIFELLSGNQTALILNRRPDRDHPTGAVYWLSEDGNLAEQAKHLYSLLHRLDAMDFKEIFIEAAVDEGLGRSINDRLKRAAAK